METGLSMRPALRLAFAAMLAAHLSPMVANAAEHPSVDTVVPIGDLDLLYDHTRWTLDGDGHRFTLTCSTPECRHKPTTVAITVGSGEACTGRAMTERVAALDLALEFWEEPEFTTFTAHGLTFGLATLDLGCRNWAGGPVAGCTRHGWHAYIFEAAGDGCHTSPDFAEMIAGVMEGLRPR